MERIRKVICWGLEIIKRDSYVPTLGDIIAIDLTELTDKYTLVMLYSYVSDLENCAFEPRNTQGVKLYGR